MRGCTLGRGESISVAGTFLYTQICTWPVQWSIHLWERRSLSLCWVRLGIALTSPEMLMAPADWPNRVTFPGSPPKAAMFSCTQRRAAIWSSSPQFPRAWLSSVLGVWGSLSGSRASTVGARWAALLGFPHPAQPCSSKTQSCDHTPFLGVSSPHPDGMERPPLPPSARPRPRLAAPPPHPRPRPRPSLPTQSPPLRPQLRSQRVPAPPPQEAEDAEPVLQKHQHHFLAGGQVRALVRRSSAHDEGASREPDHHLDEEGRGLSGAVGGGGTAGAGDLALTGSWGSPGARAGAYTFRYRQSSLKRSHLYCSRVLTYIQASWPQDSCRHLRAPGSGGGRREIVSIQGQQ